MPEIHFILNNENRAVRVEPNETLLEVLREKLGVKAPSADVTGEIAVHVMSY